MLQCLTSEESIESHEIIIHTLPTMVRRVRTRPTSAHNYKDLAVAVTCVLVLLGAVFFILEAKSVHLAMPGTETASRKNNSTDSLRPLYGSRNTKPDSCRRQWPLIPTWRNTNSTTEATFNTSSCHLASFPSKEEMTTCLKGRRLFLLGNSIARQFAYHVPLLLGNTGDAPDLESQKKGCPKAYGGGGCSIDAPYNVTIRSFWFLYWNGKPKPSPLISSRIAPNWETDVCGDLGVGECLKKIVFQDAPTKSSDLLVTNIGIIYTLLDPRGIQDIWQWRISEVRMFIKALSEHFNGTVIWMTGSKQRTRAPTFKQDPDFFYADERTKLLDLQVLPTIIAETDWIIYDNYHINEPVADLPGYFADPIHHPGRLTRLGWEYMLSFYCKDVLPVVVTDTWL